MAESPKYTCMTPGCPGPAGRGGYCTECRASYRLRDTPHRRGYDRQWREVRSDYFSTHPKCEDCLERNMYQPTAEIHHKYPVREFPELRLVWRNLRSLCKDCHARASCDETAKRHSGEWDRIRTSGSWRALLPKPPLYGSGTNT